MQAAVFTERPFKKGKMSQFGEGRYHLQIVSFFKIEGRFCHKRSVSMAARREAKKTNKSTTPLFSTCDE